ncbi:hypothetical protein IPG41_01305 [Candidatus Peregrinibacteria bacterium]|nr:MAG: hypothetical protein IPG41_01305 [Candidatus Peregrinibacteria bacterium]
MKISTLLNSLTLGALALAASTWTLFFLQPSQASVEKGIVYEGHLPLNQSVEVKDYSAFTLNGKDGVAIFPDSKVELQWDEQSSDVDLLLEEGSVLVYTLADELSVEVITPHATVLSQHNLLVVSVDSETEDLVVYAVEHPALLTFTQEGELLNALDVPGGHRMKVSALKVNEVLAKLRLAKLSKEFPIYALSDEDLSESMNEALLSVKARYEESTLAFLNETQENSDFGPALAGLGSQVSNGYESFQQVVTVIPSAETRLEEDRKAAALTYAISHFLYGDANAAAYWLSEWKSYEQDPLELHDLYSSLFFVLPGDELYPVKEATAQLLFPHEEPLLALRREYAQIEDLLGRASQVEAEQAYARYQLRFEALLDSGAFDGAEHLAEIHREYILLELMLRSNSVFYSTDATHLLKALEEKIFALAGAEENLDEERQTFVQSKLRFLSNLFNYVLEKKITVKEASALAEELIYESETYMNGIHSEVAVKDYFESKLKEYTLSVQFMNSPEFYSYDSFEEGLVDYKKKVADLEDLNAYLQNIREGQTEATGLTLEEATTEAKDQLYTHNIQYKDVESLGDSAHRLFEVIGGRTAGYSFTGKYDREGQILYDVVVGELRFSTGLTLENANKVIESAMAEQAPVPDDEDLAPVEEVPLTESVALELIQSQFEVAGLEVSAFTFTVVDVDENTFTFEGVASAFNLPVSGTYDADAHRLSEIVWEVGSELHTLPDLNLEDFEGALEASYIAITE